MVTHTVHIIVYCDRFLNSDDKKSVRCRGEDEQVFDAVTRQPVKKSVAFWKRIGWFIEGNRAVCPECNAEHPEPSRIP